ncbi:glycosyltransferase [Clostridium sp.]|uniref:glycosyltransferase n=1 Tax=Clostridium sp. TaxID=1506 RepID=UPI002606479F|nr:glycosyltransferase [Clostridium sp.]
MDKFKVSIIIPVYNVEKYLVECLESVVNQTLDNIEIICINDGSTDGSLKILEDYNLKYKNIKIINQENSGLSAARNSGIKVAKGKYLYFLDSDDYIELNSMEECFNIAEEYKLDILSFDATVFYDSDFTTNTFKEKYDRKAILTTDVMKGKDFYNLVNKKGGYKAPVWLNFYRNEFIKENSLYFYEGIIHEDELHTMNSFIKANRIKYIPKKFFNRRLRSNSIMTSKINIKRIEGNYVIAKETYKLYLNNDLNEETKNILLFWIRRYYYNSLVFCDMTNNYNIKNEIVNDIKGKKDIIDVELDMLINSPVLFYQIEKKKIVDNLFIVHTPYHIILALALVKSDTYKKCCNEIFINDTFNIDKNQINILEKIFNKVYICNKDYNFDKAYTLIKYNIYRNIFINNETEVEMQFIIEKNLHRMGKVIHIEDGTTDYSDYIRETFNDIEIEHYNKLLNIKIEKIKVLGAHSKIKKSYLTYPELVRGELKDKSENIEIDSRLIKEAIEKLYDKFDQDTEVLNNKINILIALEHSEFFYINNSSMDNYLTVINEIIYKAKEKNINIYLKYHPREKNKYLDKHIIQSDNVKFVKNSIAIEAFYSFKNLYLISRVSTSLMTFCKVLDSKRAICIEKIFDEDSNRLIEVFEKLNIFLPNTIDEIIQKINNKI